MDQLTPYFVEKPWGGDFIASQFHLPHRSYGEAWLLSTLPGAESRSGARPLSEALGKELSFIVKIIDARSPLSVQVHPDDHWARALENSRGKTECWLILKAQKDSGVYLGLKDGVGEEELRRALEKNQNVQELLIFHPVKPGDFISVPAGTIHAIGAGITLLEVQQASGITYRIWDWGETGRQLHVEKGLQVSHFAARPGVLFNVFENNSPRLLIKEKDFQVELNKSSGEGWFIGLEDLSVSFGNSSPAAAFVFVK